MTDIIRTPTGPGRRPTPLALALTAELIVWAGLLAFIVFAVRSCT